MQTNESATVWGKHSSFYVFSGKIRTNIRIWEKTFLFVNNTKIHYSSRQDKTSQSSVLWCFWKQRSYAHDTDSAVDFNNCLRACVCTKLLRSCLILCEPVNCSPPGSSVHGSLQARVLEWAAKLPSRGSSQPKDRNCISCGSCIAARFFTAEPLAKPI